MNYQQDVSKSYLYDAHCHLSPSVRPSEMPKLMNSIQKKLSNEPASIIQPIFNLMSTNHIDIHLVHQLSNAIPQINPNYGVHPWYSHLFTTTNYSDKNLSQYEIKQLHYEKIMYPPPPKELLDVLPVPVYLSNHIALIRNYLHISQNSDENIAPSIGEIGLDKTFRIPWTGYHGNNDNMADMTVKEGLSPCRITLEHQIDVFEALLNLALEESVSISVHCVGCHGKLFELVSQRFNKMGKNYDGSNIALHSYSGSVSNLQQWLSKYSKVRISISKVLSIDKYKNQITELLTVEEGKKLKKWFGLQNILIETDLSLNSLFDENIDKHANMLTEVFENLKLLNSGVTVELLVRNYEDYLRSWYGCK